MNTPKSTYQDLFNIVKNKNYFVITTNVDHCFEKSGFDKKRIFYTQGDYGLFQCSEPCCNKPFENKDMIIDMIEHQHNMKIPYNMIPKCPYCGKPLTMNLRANDKFVQEEGWYNAAERYQNFLQQQQNKHILYLELGVGYNTPIIIKYPFWQMTVKNTKAIYACVNYGEASCPHNIEKQSICINNDISKILKELNG